MLVRWLRNYRHELIHPTERLMRGAQRVFLALFGLVSLVTLVEILTGGKIGQLLGAWLIIIVSKTVLWMMLVAWRELHRSVDRMGDK